MMEHLKTHIESAPSGITVYISLGADARTVDMTRDKLYALLDVCEQLADVHFLLKWELSDFDIDRPLPSNLRTAAWFPQEAVLAHSGVAVFVSTCGLLSVIEAINSGTPLLAIPMLPEQEATAKRLQERGVAILLRYEAITYDAVLQGIEGLVRNASYTAAIARLQRQFKYGCDIPLARALQHIDLLVEGGVESAFLQSYANRLSFWRVELLDVRAILTLGLGLILAVPFLLTCCILRRSYNKEAAAAAAAVAANYSKLCAVQRSSSVSDSGDGDNVSDRLKRAAVFTLSATSSPTSSLASLPIDSPAATLRRRHETYLVHSAPPTTIGQ